MSSPARIAFAGTPEFAVPALRALAASGAIVPAVLTQPDRPAGRGRQLTASAVKLAADRLGLPVAQPASLTKSADFSAFGEPPELLVVVAYGLLLPRWMLSWPKLGCINLHASLLPRWRGAAPIQHAILEGDEMTGISVMQMEAGLDTGPVYLARSTPIGKQETAGDLHDRLAALAAEVLQETLPQLLARRLTAAPQRPQLATWAPKISKSAALLDWGRPAVRLERQVRAFNPWPVAEGELSDGRRLRIWQAAAIEAAALSNTGIDPRAPPGTIVATGQAGIDVATAAGVLRLQRIQPPSGRVMDAPAYLAAHSLEGAAFVS